MRTRTVLATILILQYIHGLLLHYLYLRIIRIMIEHYEISCINVAIDGSRYHCSRIKDYNTKTVEIEIRNVRPTVTFGSFFTREKKYSPEQRCWERRAIMQLEFLQGNRCLVL